MMLGWASTTDEMVTLRMASRGHLQGFIANWNDEWAFIPLTEFSAARKKKTPATRRNVLACDL